MTQDVQESCTGSFTEILPRPAMGLREYGQSDDWRAPDGDFPTFGRFVLGQFNFHVGLPFFFSPACHSRSVIARSACGKALNHQSQTPLNRGLTVFSYPTEATLGDFATSERAETDTDLYGWSKDENNSG